MIDVRSARRTFVGGVLTLLGVAALAGCSGGDDSSGQAPLAGPALGTAGTRTGEPTAPPGPPPTAPPPETGVPGLDSDDAFCAAWSRFAGSFQVVAIASSFAAPGEASRLEVAASGTVASAHAEMMSRWPAELAAEHDAMLIEAFGGFAARAERAASYLSPDVVGAVDAAWLDALARRNPDEALLDVQLDGRAAAALAAAADAFGAEVVPVNADPTLVSDVATPLTDAYLAEHCPDEGLLAGSDVVEE